MNCNAYRYQARITGSAFDTEECRWSDEWNWLGTPFDGFQPGECTLQECKGQLRSVPRRFDPEGSKLV
ncbi:restriction endonuclease fold toxin 5 domain-containing protein [Burkholderia multivorans]|nr:hypothetical protein [Burkholderia multivorans]MBU9120162.1 restriction endonuclease fold toxin 5 domain-containing protein [Burkholderia multivorans]MBU9435790.1 restriction endonuclease fold toxin 5 domain-containing protein [Burkholderia multivorans]MBU9472375.1 restriction endonuclease fold toxin 5 domain-containing protein [Burkholderia multivorans]MBU9518800.1 restriction endonuclease fold toxin 5 domain-containing protein [Burkholderia multivorans]